MENLPKIIDNAYAAGIALVFSGTYLISLGNGNQVLGFFLILFVVGIILFRFKIDYDNAKSNRQWQMPGQKI